MPGLGTRDNRGERPYVIAYVRGDRKLYDSATTLEGARARIERRLSKRHNRGEVGHIYLGGKLIREISRNSAGGWTTGIDIRDV